MPRKSQGISTIDRLKTVISEQFGVDIKEISPKSAFIEDLGADSLDVVELVMGMEEEFGISIPDQDIEKMNTVQDAVDYLEDKGVK